MNTVELKTALSVASIDGAGHRTERRYKTITDAIADWSWVAPGCLRITMWGSAKAKDEARAKIKAGGTTTADVYVVPASNVLCITMPAVEFSGPSAIVRATSLVGPH